MSHVLGFFVWQMVFSYDSYYLVNLSKLNGYFCYQERWIPSFNRYTNPNIEEQKCSFQTSIDFVGAHYFIAPKHVFDDSIR